MSSSAFSWAVLRDRIGVCDRSELPAVLPERLLSTEMSSSASTNVDPTVVISVTSARISSRFSGKPSAVGSGGTIVLSLRWTRALCSKGSTFTRRTVDLLHEPFLRFGAFPPPPRKRPLRSTLEKRPALLRNRSTALSKNATSASPLP